MSEATSNWADNWMAGQAAFFKAMSPSTWPGAAASSDARDAVQDQFKDLQETWKASIEKWSAFVKDGSNLPSMTPEALRQAFAPARWGRMGADTLDAGLRHAIEGPKYATLWDMDRKLAELQQLALRRDKDILALQTIVQRAWKTAFNRFAAGYGSKDAPPLTTWRAAADRWLAIVNETLIDAHRSEEFVEAQSRMVRSASDYRLQERKLAEAWCEACHIPTRSEMDEMQRSVTELRRELRLQRRQHGRQPERTTPPSSPRKPRAVASKARRATAT